MPESDPEYIDHFRDIGYVCTKNCMKNYIYEYNPEFVNDVKSKSWKKIPDIRVDYRSKKHPWLVFGARFHNKVNQH